jgi:hypothetical protein
MIRTEAPVELAYPDIDRVPQDRGLELSVPQAEGLVGGRLVVVERAQVEIVTIMRIETSCAMMRNEGSARSTSDCEREGDPSAFRSRFGSAESALKRSSMNP